MKKLAVLFLCLSASAAAFAGIWILQSNERVGQVQFCTYRDGAGHTKVLTISAQDFCQTVLND